SSTRRRDWTPLRMAATAGRIEVIRLLVEAGADADANAMWEVDQTPLMAAAERGDAKTVEALLAAGADPRRKSFGETAEDLASAAGHAEVVALLRKNYKSR